MATIRVWSGGDGTDGLTWATAYQTLLAAVDSLTDADHTILVQYDHTESTAATVDLNGPINHETGTFTIVSVDKDNSDVYRKSTIDNIVTTGTTSDIIFDGCFDVYGLGFLAGDDIDLQGDQDEIQRFTDCSLTVPSTGVLKSLNITNYIHFTDTDIDVSSSQMTLANFTMIGGSIIGSNTAGVVAQKTSGSLTVELSGVDLTGITGGVLFDNVTSSIFTAKVIGCKLPSGISFVANGDEFNRVIVTGSDDVSGNDIDRHEIATTAFGSIVKSTSVYRTGGANDGTNDYSLLLSGGSYTTKTVPLRTEWGEGYIDSSGAKTITAYIANNTQATSNDNVWLEVRYFGDSASTLMSFKASRPNTPIDSATANASDTSTWNGATLSYKEKLEVSITAGRSGPFLWRIGSDGTADFYLDPKIAVT